MRGARLFAPEVIQSSAMDCGPAALKCLLDGFGVPVSYDRLREACQTGLDGTSINTLEAVAARLGLDAEQVMLPADHLFLPEARVLPALLVVSNSLGVTHFIVVWRRYGPWLQVMDPATGRRWTTVRELLGEVYLHAMPVPAEAWREWAGGEDFLGVLQARMKVLGMDGQERDGLIREALADPSWQSLAALDASVRMVSSLADSGAVRRGRESASLARAAFEERSAPDAYGSVAPFAAGEGSLLLRGAVLVRVRGRRDGAGQAVEEEGLPPELKAVLEEPSGRPGRELLRLFKADGLLAPATLTAAMAVAAGAVVLEALFFRGLLDLSARLGLAEQRLAAGAVFLLFLALLLLLDLSIADGALALGRKLEVRLRLGFLGKLSRLGDRYFRSRLSSDMAERCHSVYRLRLLPELGANLLRSAFQLAFTAAGIAWLDPDVAPLAASSAVLAFSIPLLAQPILSERDLRLRSHAGALGRFYLDSLLGLIPARNHGAERALRREHEGLLVEWTRAALRFESVTVALDLFQATLGYGLAILLLFRHVGSVQGPTQALLLGYWSIQLLILGQQVDVAARQYPLLRNTARRLIEPLAAVEDRTFDAQVAEPASVPSGLSLRMEGVRVVAAGHVLLDGVDLALEPGMHVAIVGASGAGKSTLVGLLLGWHVPAAGEVLIDGEPLTPERLEALRGETAWIDPAVQLWNAPLLDNLRYGSTGGDLRVGRAVEEGELRRLLEDLPQGLQSPLGEGGALVSGGEGQRVRFARSLLRPEARLVILDEPFRGLDREARGRLLDRARNWWRNATLLCITHDVGQTRAFDQVIVVKEGRVVEIGCPRELEGRASSFYKELLDREAALQRRFRESVGWRRLRLVDGGLIEEGRDG